MNRGVISRQIDLKNNTGANNFNMNTIISTSFGLNKKLKCKIVGSVVALNSNGTLMNVNALTKLRLGFVPKISQNNISALKIDSSTSSDYDLSSSDDTFIEAVFKSSMTSGTVGNLGFETCHFVLDNSGMDILLRGYSSTGIPDQAYVTLYLNIEYEIIE